ncbi:MAG: pitrilysin family protein [Thermodesulfobacteriota bacterium]
MRKVERPRLGRFPGGLQFLFVPNRAAPALALDLWVRAGSADEAPGEEGMAHLVEHMLFKGSERRGPGEAARQVEGLGGEINAYTSHDHTVYSLVLASRYAELGIEILADAVRAPSFDPAELEREKAVVVEELRRSRDLPHHVLSQLLFSHGYRVHPYGRSILGREETVGAFSPGDCQAFHRRWYRPGNMVLVAAGDAAPEVLEARVGELLSPGKPARAPRRRRPREPRAEGFRACFQARDLTEVYFDLAFPGPAARHPDVAAVDLLMAVLVQGEASRLQHRVKLDRNLVRTVSGGAYTPDDPGLLCFGGVAEPGRFGPAFEAIAEEVFRFQRELPGPRELERARENLEADFVYQKETAEGQARKAGFFHVVLGGTSEEDRYLARLHRVSAEDLRVAARKYFRADRAVLVALHPTAGPLGIAGDEAGSLLARAEAGARRPGRGGGRGRRASSREGLVRRVLPNGARILVKENRAVPIAAARAVFLGGLRREPPSLAGAYHLLGLALVRGTASRSAYDIAHEMDAVGGHLEGFSGRNSFGLKAELLSRYLEDGLDLFAEVLCHPTFPEEEVEKLRDDTLAALGMRRDNPAGYAFRLLEELLFGSHPYGRDVLGCPETVQGLDGEALRRLHGRADPRELAVAVAGDVDAGEVCDFFERALEVLEPGLEGGFDPAPPPRIEAPLVRELAWAAEQAHVAVGFPGTRLGSPDRAAVQVLTAVLAGQGGRFFRRLREERALAYAVSCSSLEGLDPGYLAGYAATTPARASEARECLLEEFALAARAGITAQELEQAQRKLVGGFELALQENASQAAQMALDEVYGLGHRSFETYARRIFGVSAADVTEAARRYLLPEAHACVVLRPAEGA